MKIELKQQIINALNFLKSHQDIDNLTLSQIQERMVEYEGLLITFVEKLLEDEETINGTMTEWWLYESVPKFIYEGKDGKPETFDDKPIADLTKAEDFVNFMIDSSKPVG